MCPSSAGGSENIQAYILNNSNLNTLRRTHRLRNQLEAELCDVTGRWLVVMAGRLVVVVG
jgi:hypothetical protein